MRPAEQHSPSAEENCLTENVASLRSVKVATPPCAAKAAIPCGLAAGKFESEELNFMEQANRKLWRKSIMKKIMFGNSLMLLGIAIMILAGLELIYIGIMWASFLLIPVGFIMSVIGFFSKDS